jgi:hypothetical protein
LGVLPYLLDRPFGTINTFYFAESLCEAAYNFMEFMALKLLVLMAKEKGIS